MLGLAAPTSPDWAPRALAQLDEVLIDHAHCEKKAASTAISLLFRYPDQPALCAAIPPLAREELAHFEQVLAALAARGVRYRKQTPSPYASRLVAAIRPNEPERMLDTLLCLALIEARSCERMRLLAEALGDDSLAALYRGLLASEARHHQTYVDLAHAVAPGAPVRERLLELARHEASVLAEPSPLPRLHA